MAALPTGHMTLLRRWINVIDVDSTSQQRRVPSGLQSLNPSSELFNLNFQSFQFRDSQFQMTENYSDL